MRKFFSNKNRWAYPLSAIWAFDHIENKDTLYRGKASMKMFCESWQEHAKNVIDFEKKEMLPLTKEEVKSQQDTKVCYICQKRILKKVSKSKHYPKVRDHWNYMGK